MRRRRRRRRRQEFNVDGLSFRSHFPAQKTHKLVFLLTLNESSLCTQLHNIIASKAHPFTQWQSRTATVSIRKQFSETKSLRHSASSLCKESCVEEKRFRDGWSVSRPLSVRICLLPFISQPHSVVHPTLA